MHEIGCVEDIVKIVKDRLRLNNVKGKVLNIKVCIAQLTEVSEENLRLWFGQLTMDTQLEGAELIIRQIPMPAGKNFFVESIEAE